jgi:FkbM family methyltransferase
MTADPPVRPRPPLSVRAGVWLVRRLPAGRYRAMSALADPATPPFYARTGPAVGGHRFVCHLADAVAREVCYTGRYEPQETAIVSGLLGPGQTFVDVGANWGYYTLLAAGRVGPAGRVVSLEPDPRMYRLLTTNVSANALAQVTARPVAASTGPGEVRFTGFDAAGGNWGVSSITGAGGNGFTAQTAAVDALLDELGVSTVDLVKMDIEGAEDLALGGMAAGLTAGRYRAVLVEFHPAQLAARGRTAGELIDGLRAVGYGAWSVRHDRAFTRQAAYARRLDPRAALRPYDPAVPLSDWPHLLFARRDPFPPDGNAR